MTRFNAPISSCFVLLSIFITLFTLIRHLQRLSTPFQPNPTLTSRNSICKDTYLISACDNASSSSNTLTYPCFLLRYDHLSRHIQGKTFVVTGGNSGLGKRVVLLRLIIWTNLLPHFSADRYTLSGATLLSSTRR